MMSDVLQPIPVSFGVEFGGQIGNGDGNDMRIRRNTEEQSEREINSNVLPMLR